MGLGNRHIPALVVAPTCFSPLLVCFLCHNPIGIAFPSATVAFGQRREHVEFIRQDQKVMLKAARTTTMRQRRERERHPKTRLTSMGDARIWQGTVEAPHAPRPSVSTNDKLPKNDKLHCQRSVEIG